MMNIFRYNSLLCIAVAALFVEPCLASKNNQHALEIISGIFYGPGDMPDSPLPTGRLGHITLDENLTGRTSYFNNGDKPPNIKSEKEIDGVVDGKLSNGVPFNEHIDGGIAEVGLGAMRFMTVVASNGPNEGSEKFTLLGTLDWQIITDLALDPGFADGVVTSNDLLITTGLLSVPFSLQTLSGKKNGMDTAGSLPSGLDIVGRLGDFDFNGYLDGVISGASHLPLDHMLIPGAPVVQSREFKSDIPIDAFHAAVLTISGINNYQPIMARMFSVGKDAPTFYTKASAVSYIDDIVKRIETAKKLIKKTQLNYLSSSEISEHISKLDLLKDQLLDLKRWKRSNVGQELYKYDKKQKISEAMIDLEALTTQLKSVSKYKDV